MVSGGTVVLSLSKPLPEWYVLVPIGLPMFAVVGIVVVYCPYCGVELPREVLR